MTLEEVISEIEHSVRLGVPSWAPSEAIINALFMLKDYKDLRTVNTELKRLLRLAVDDLDKSIKACETDMLCEICSYEAECNCLNYCFIDKNLRSWKHHDEAMKLLGEEQMPLPDPPKGEKNER